MWGHLVLAIMVVLCLVGASGDLLQPSVLYPHAGETSHYVMLEGQSAQPQPQAHSRPPPPPLAGGRQPPPGSGTFLTSPLPVLSPRDH